MHAFYAVGAALGLASASVAFVGVAIGAILRRLGAHAAGEASLAKYHDSDGNLSHVALFAIYYSAVPLTGLVLAVVCDYYPPPLSRFGEYEGGSASTPFTRAATSKGYADSIIVAFSLSLACLALHVLYSFVAVWFSLSYVSSDEDFKDARWKRWRE